MFRNGFKVDRTNPLTCSWVIPPAMEKPKLTLGGLSNSISSKCGGDKRRINWKIDHFMFTDIIFE